MAEFSEKDLKNLQELCKIKCSEEEEIKFLKNLKSILKYMDQIDHIEVDCVMGRHNLLECETNKMYEDKEEITLLREEFLHNAPSQIGGMVRIPPVIEV